MIAVDTGFLFALADADDAWHERARAQLGTTEQGWITTWPVVTETCQLLAARLDPGFAADFLDAAPGRHHVARQRE